MPTIRIENRLGVAAPAHTVWQVVADLEHWGEWNPAYAKAAGRLSIGAPIVLDATFPGVSPRQLSGTVVDWVPDIQLVWKSKAGFMATSLRFIEIEKLSDHGCILANGEIVEGFGARYLSNRDRRAAQRAYEAMNEAIKARAEEMWRRAGGRPT